MHVTVFTGFSCKKFEVMELKIRYEEYIGVFIITYENNKSQLRFQHSVLIPGRAAATIKISACLGSRGRPHFTDRIQKE